MCWPMDHVRHSTHADHHRKKSDAGKSSEVNDLTRRKSVVSDEYDWDNGPWQHEDARQAAFEIWIYIIFITIFAQQSSRSIFRADWFYFSEGVKGQFTGVEMLPEHSPVFGKIYDDITVVEEYYHWLLGGFSHTVFRTNTFDGSDWMWKGADPLMMMGHNTYLGGVRVSHTADAVLWYIFIPIIAFVVGPALTLKS